MCVLIFSGYVDISLSLRGFLRMDLNVSKVPGLKQGHYVNVSLNLGFIAVFCSGDLLSPLILICIRVVVFL